MANTRIVLNRQSDLVLTEAQIVAPVGIVEADIAGLVAHFQTVEQSISTEISDRGVAVAAEESSRIAADSSLETSISEEFTRAKDAEGLLGDKIDEEKNRIDSILLASDADKDSFAEIVTLINSVDTENDQAFASYVLSNDAALSSEISSRVSADTSLESSKLDLAGGTMSGVLDMDYNEITNIDVLHTNELVSVDGPSGVIQVAGTLGMNDGVIAELGAPTNGGDATNKTYVDAADSSLETRLSVEESRAENAEASIGQVLSTEVSSIISNTDLTAIDSFAEVVSEVSAEISSRVSADASLESKINEEVARATAKDSKHDDDISAEESSRISGDASLEAKIIEDVTDLSKALSEETSRAQDVEGQLGKDLSEEVSRAQAKDAEHDAAIAAEEAARIAGDSSLETSIEEVETARKQGEQSLEDKVSTEKGRIDAILSAATADSDSFAEIVTLINSVDTENDQAFASYVLSNNAALSTEESSRIAGDASLQAFIEEEIEEQENGRVANALNISAEASSRIAADASLEVVLSAEISVQNSIDQAIKDGVNGALVEIKSMIMEAIQGGRFRMLSTIVGDGVTTLFGTPLNGNGAIYLNGLLQEEGVDYTFTTSIDGKGNPNGEFTFNDAPEVGASVVIYGQVGYVIDPTWYRNLTPLA